MIEGDINERMARFAPSQNVDPALDVIRQRRGLLPPSSVAPSFAEMPDIAQPEGPDPIVDMLLDRRKERLNSTLYGAMRVDPDQAARAQKLAPDVGVGADMVMRHLPDMERQARLADIERRRLYMNDPVLSNFLEQKEFAEVAHDDVGSLSKVKGIFESIAEIPTSVSEGFRRGIATYELAGLLDKQRQRGGSVDVIEQAAINSINDEIAALGKESGFWESATNIVTLNLAQAPEYVEPIVTGGVAGGAAGAALGLGGGPLAPATVPVGMATGIGLGLKAGAVTGAFEASRRLETALLYGQAREEGLDHDAANKVALAGGAVSGLLELVGVGIAGKAYSLAVKQVIRRSMNEALKNRTKMAVLKEAGLLYVGGGLGETATEVAQEIVNQTAIEAGKFMRDKPMIFNDPEEMQAFGDRLVDTAIETAKGMALIGLPGAGVQIYTGTRRAAKAERQQEVIQSLVENRKESKYANRDPQGYERFLAAQSEGTPAETIYIDGMVAQQVLAQSGVTVAELEQVMPGIRQRIVDAVATGGDVTIPTAQFGARLANTDLGTAMLPHVRLSPDAMSMTEVQEFKSRMQDERRLADEALQAAESVRDTFVAEAQAVRDWAREQAIAAGQDADAADVAASMYQAFVVTQAAEQNMTPAQFQAAQGVRGIQGIIGEMAPAAAPLEQANRDLIASVDAELGGIMDAAKEASRAAGKTRSKETQAAAFKAKQDWIAANPARYAEYQAAQRTDALENERVREAAASALAGKIDESLATAAKTLTDAGFVLDYESPAPSKSRYYRKGNTLIRLSDHEIPVTHERAAAREAGVQVPYRDFVFDGTAVDAELIQDLEAFAARTTANIMEQAAVLEQAGADAPGVGVAKENKLGFWPALRVRIQPDDTLPEKPLILTGTTNKNATKQLANIDAILGRFPNAAESPEAWAQMLAYAFGSDDVPVPPYAFIRDTNGTGSLDRLSTLTAGQIADATHGFENAREFRRAYTSGELDVVTTGKLFLWSFLSRGVSPYTQESLFIDAFDGADRWIRKAADGQFTTADLDAYEKWAKSVAPKGGGQPGAGATHNLNAFGKNFLIKMGAIGEDGKSNLQRLHEMMSDPAQTGKQIRREFAKFGEGVGIDNKVVSFTLLVAGFNDVMVLDRVQVRQLWDDGRFSGTNLYDGVMDAEGKKIAGSSLNALTEGVRGILVYEAIERQLESKIDALYAALGRPQDASIGRYHWETWVAYSQQEAAHATLDAILLDAKGDDQAIAKVSGKQGEYGAYEYGAQYNRDTERTPWFRYTTPLGGTYDFSVPAFRQFLTEIKKVGNGVVPAKFKVTESGNAPWYTRPEVNQQRLEEQAAKWSDRGGGTGEGTRLAREAAANADAMRARSRAGVQPAGRAGVLEQAAAAPGPRGEVLFQSPVAPDFYSALEREVAAIDAKALTASGWNERFKGLISKGAIKADELEWSGLADYLKMQEGKVSKDAVLEFLRGNGVRVERVTLDAGSQQGAILSAMESGIASARLDMENEGAMTPELSDAFDKYEEHLALGDVTTPASREYLSSLADIINPAMAAANQADLDEYFQEAEDYGDASDMPQPRYERYTLPGGTNYREVLLTLPAGFQAPTPVVSLEGVAAREAIFAKYAPRLAELEREGNNLMLANRALTDEEAQRLADVRNEFDQLEAQRNAEARAAYEIPERPAAPEFRTTHWAQPNVLVHLRMNDRMDADGKRVLFVEEVQSDWGQAGVKRGFMNQREEDRAKLSELQAVQETDPSDATAKQIARLEARLRKNQYDVVLAPYVQATDGWLSLGLKQIMLEAVRGNYDRVAFVTGDQSKERYKLSKQISRVVYKDNFSGGIAPATMQGPPSAGRLFAYDLNGLLVIEEAIEDYADIENYIGKEVADKLLQSEPKPGDLGGIQSRDRELSGLDLDVGGEGMVEFYDKIVPIAMNKLLKKYGGGKIGTVEIDTRTPESEAYYAEPTDADILPQPGFAITPEMVKKLESGLPLFQAAAAPGPRGGFDVRRMMVMLTKASDRTTLWHEFVHFFLHMYTEAAVSGRASERQRNDLDLLLKWFKIEGETPAERLAKWSAMTLDQKRKHHEALTYNAEIYAFEGKAPSAELIPVFERLRAFMLRVYKSIRDDLNAIYRREFGEDLPILTGEVREVMDRMLATDEQIRRQAAINEMKPAFQTQEQAQMSDAEWAAYKAMEQEAIEASITDMNKASLRQMQWLSNARSRIVRDMQRKHDRQRKEVSAEVAAAVRVEPVYRAMTYLRTGKFIDADGTEIAVEGPHRLDIKRVKEIYETVPTAESLAPVRATGMPVPTVVQPDLAKLGTGSYGMMGVDGLDPDMVAETFGYSSGDELIRALVAAKPMKEEVAARTDAEMLRRYGDMNTPEAVEAEVQKSLHNEARARMLAVELRWRTKATQPVRVMLEAAKQVARDLIAGKRIRDVRPSDFVAAESRASRDIQRLQNLPNPVAIGMAAQTRALNDRLAKGMDNATAMAEAIVEGAKAAQAAEERNAALKAQYGADPQQALIRASRAQLYQNQLAAEALRVQEEVAKDIKYLRRVLRDENVKRMGAPAADQIAGLLERYEVAPVSLKRLDERRALTEWLAQQAELGLVPDIAPEIVNEARRVNYREVKVSEFRDLVDAIRQIEHIGKRERKAAQEKLRAEFDALKAEAIQSMKDVAAKRGRKARKELGDEDRKWAQLIAGYDAMQQTIGSIVYVLDGGQRDGPLARILLFTANDAGNQETTDRADATLALSKILDPIERKGQFSGRKLYFPQIDDSLSLEQRMVVALNYGNQSNIDRLLNGEKWTDEQVQPILESLTEEQLNAVQAIWNYLESFKPRVAAQERNLLGREPNWIEPRPFTVRSADGKVVNMAGGYYPAKYNPRRSSMSREMDESVEADRQMREAITAATTTRSYTKNRLDKPPGGGVLSRQMGGLYAGINEVIHDLAWRTWAMDANRLLRDKEFQTVIKSIYGDETYKAIKNWVDSTVRGERGNYDVIENIAIGVRRNVSVSAMGLKFITAAIQVTGLIPATVRTGITPMVRAVAYFAANPRESSRIAREKSSFMRNRGRTRYRDLNEIANIVRGESRARRAYLANAYALIGLQQGMVDMSVWWAAYSKAIKEGKAEEMAVSIADQTVIDTQGSGMLKDLSQAMRGGQKQSAYAKLFTSFYQFSNTQYALLSAQLRTAPSMGKAAADAFTILVVGAFIEEMLRTLLKPSPDDEEPEDLAKALIDNQIDFVIGLPFGGGELRGIGDMIVGEQAMQYRGPSGLRMVGEVRTFAGQTLQGEFDRAWTRSAINMSGLIWGIPSAQINDTIDGINAAVEGEVEGAEAALAPITGVRR